MVTVYGSTDTLSRAVRAIPWRIRMLQCCDALPLWLATAAALTVHEAGHAAAAAAEGVPLHHAAASLALLLPGAWVALEEGALAALPPQRQLRVVCAGVWHNVVLCACFWAAAAALPLVLSPLYAAGSGAAVERVPRGSPLARHLAPGDAIVGVGSCAVASGAVWGAGGDCMTDELCWAGGPGSMEPNPAGLAASANQENVTAQHAGNTMRTALAVLRASGQGVCLKARAVASNPPCQAGSAAALAAGVQVGDYVPRRWAARAWLAPPSAPAAISRLLAYAFSVSAAVALLNAAPVVHLDGDAALGLK
ncbi:hypothetical protein WJX81_000744 [Elliptochloris bilobata]|uniref:Endopeptidase S2P n=1 Tax=Elliptochloris bilobata TaxID=381761 RepID=A0AAW1R0A5_9CHLO